MVDILAPLPSNHSILVLVDYYSCHYEHDVMTSTIAEKPPLTVFSVDMGCLFPLNQTIVCSSNLNYSENTVQIMESDM